MWRHALVVGKFLPPHAGHHALIDAAARVAAHVTVVVCDDAAQRPPAQRRANWVQAIHPFADVIVVADTVCTEHRGLPCRPACSPAWAQRLAAAGVAGVDVVVSSESYGPLLATAMRIDHHAFDNHRTSHDVSGTAVRSDLTGCWTHLHPVVRSGLHRRIAVIGAESTGTTTLARDLAQQLGAPLTHEVGRTMSWALAARAGAIDDVTWTDADFWAILHGQRAAEVAATMTAAAPGPLGPWLVCDTDATATVAWWERYLTTGSAAAVAYAMSSPADLYVVTSPDGVDFVDDGVRDGPDRRLGMHDRFVELAAATNMPWLTVTGDRATRLRAVLDAIAAVCADEPLFAA